MTKEEATKILDDVLDRLGEHFDSVQIVATLVQDRATKHYQRGTGDFYARRGATDKWLRDDEQEDATYVRLNVEDRYRSDE